MKASYEIERTRERERKDEDEGSVNSPIDDQRELRDDGEELGQGDLPRSFQQRRYWPKACTATSANGISSRILVFAVVGL
jgi:hypothetical protein